MTAPGNVATAGLHYVGASTYSDPAGLTYKGKGKSRYDKTDPYGGTFRAYLAQDWPESLVGKVVGVSIDGSGKLVIGNGTAQGATSASGLVGVIVLTQAHKVSEGQVDVMRFGCIVGFQPTVFDWTQTATGASAAGTKYYADSATGFVSSTAAGGVYVGTTLGKDRLEVSVQFS